MRPTKPPDHSIVCAVDFSRHSAMALRYAATLALRVRAQLAVVFAVDPFLSAAAAAAYDTDALKRTALLELRRFVRKALGPNPRVPVHFEIVVGKAARAILSAATRLDAKTLVIGTHGLSGVKKAFFGSTSAALLRRTSIPVLAIPPRTRSPRERWPEAAAVAAVPFGDRIGQDAGLMSEVASFLGVPLDLVVTVPDARAPLWARVSKRAMDERQIEQARAWLDRRLTAGSATGTHVLVGDRADDVAAFAAGRGADLILSRATDRDVTYRLLCVARCPVLVLPPQSKGGLSAIRRRFRSAA